MSADQNPSSSFRKKARVKVGQIQGTRPSLYNNQLLISTGIPSLDNFIGGGLAVGTVLLVEEDVYSSYSRLFLKYFLAEAVVTKQSIFMSSLEESTEKLIKELPAPIDQTGQTSATTGLNRGKPNHTPEQDKDEKMKIAWRYQNQQKIQAPQSISQFGHYYDLTKTMEQDLLDENLISHASDLSAIDFSDHSGPPMCMNKRYCRLLNEIRQRIGDGGFSTTHQAEKRSVLRIGIHSLGSPQWGEAGGVAMDDKGPSVASLTLFLIALRAELRSAFATALITVPTHLFQDTAFTKRVERLCDTVIRIESFAGSDKEKNPVFKDYHGLVHIERVPRLNSLVPAQIETPDLAFKLRRKKLTIERLHLPPELSSGDAGGSGDMQSSSPCGSSSSKLDF